MLFFHLELAEKLLLVSGDSLLNDRSVEFLVVSKTSLRMKTGNVSNLASINGSFCMIPRMIG